MRIWKFLKAPLPLLGKAILLISLLTREVMSRNSYEIFERRLPHSTNCSVSVLIRIAMRIREFLTEFLPVRKHFVGSAAVLAEFCRLRVLLVYLSNMIASHVFV